MEYIINHKTEYKHSFCGIKSVNFVAYTDKMFTKYSVLDSYIRKKRNFLENTVIFFI